jgi:hypothetical protein
MTAPSNRTVELESRIASLERRPRSGRSRGTARADSRPERQLVRTHGAHQNATVNIVTEAAGFAVGAERAVVRDWVMAPFAASAWRSAANQICHAKLLIVRSERSVQRSSGHNSFRETHRE